MFGAAFVCLSVIGTCLRELLCAGVRVYSAVLGCVRVFELCSSVRIVLVLVARCESCAREAA